MLIMLLICSYSTATYGDGLVVDKVYHPYVLANEQEVEWRFMSSQTDTYNRLGQRLGYGRSLSDTFAIDVYLIGHRDDNLDFGLSAYEIEGRWMLTEQGQYWADWGMLFEVEKKYRTNDWEVTTGFIAEKEFGKSSLTVNFFIVQEWGDNIPTEMETEFRLKYRYRFMPEVQPAFEVYSGEDFFGLGPAFMGIHRFEGQKQLKWELGFISEVSHSGKDHTLRFALEYEF
ncbi:hypothetical protein [Thalassotalea profundi]|nr:hypothetical protein [Thalassotalea profundi]